MIFDTNVLIYLSKYQLQPEKLFIEPVKISVISKIEALGFNFSHLEEHQMLLSLCKEIPVVPLTDKIAETTISIRQKYKIKLPDAIIYATALVEHQSLLTNNIDDFKKLDGRVQLIDPFTL